MHGRLRKVTLPQLAHFLSVTRRFAMTQAGTGSAIPRLGLWPTDERFQELLIRTINRIKTRLRRFELVGQQPEFLQ
jgi:hypothetical protein